MHLVVTDIEAAQAELAGRGVEVSDVRHIEAGGLAAGAGPGAADYNSFADFADPDGNTWVLQEVVKRGAGDRGDACTDESTFGPPAERHRRELHVHCYRMLASFDEAEDAVQETLLRAWRGRDALRGRHAGPGLALQDRHQRLPGRHPGAGPGGWPSCTRTPRCGWLQPYPDRLLDEMAPPEDEPDAVVVGRETIELAFLAALQVLPPRQRAALVLRDVLGLPAAETAAMLDTSVAAANSALQRARAAMQEHLPSHRLDWAATPPSAGRAGAAGPVHRRARAVRRRGRAGRRGRGHPGDHAAGAVLLRRAGRAGRALLERAFGAGAGRRLAAAADERQPDAGRGQLPAPARRHRVPRVQAGRAADRGRHIAEITTFGYALFPHFGLPIGPAGP